MTRQPSLDRVTNPLAQPGKPWSRRAPNRSGRIPLRAGGPKGHPVGW